MEVTMVVHLLLDLVVVVDLVPVVFHTSLVMLVQLRLHLKLIELQELTHMVLHVLLELLI